MTDETTPAERRRRTVPAGAFVVAVMVAVALGVLAVVALATAPDEAGASSDQEVRLAAGRFAERFLTFENDALDEWQQEVLALATPGFAEEVEEVEASLRTLIDEGELDATTQVTDVFVGEEERGAVSVVVVYDRTVTGAEVDRTESDRYAELALVRIDGEWLVDNVIDIASASDLGGAVAPSTTPTTGPARTATAPASTSTEPAG